MGEVWPTGHITELCLQLTASSRPVNGDEHQTLSSQSCERALLTTGDFTFTLPLNSNNINNILYTESSLIYHYNTRGKSNLYVSSIQSEFGRRSLMHKDSILWNKLPDNLKTMYSTSELKEKLRHLLYSE